MLIKFIEDMIPRIPCPMCRHNAQRYISLHGHKLNDTIHYDDREVNTLVWISDFHNDVNYRNKKRIIHWKDTYRTYKNKYNSPNYDKIDYIIELIDKLN